MIGKILRPFSNEWKTFSGANVLVSGLAPGFANGMRLEGAFRSGNGNARGDAMAW